VTRKRLSHTRVDENQITRREECQTSADCSSRLVREKPRQTGSWQDSPETAAKKGKTAQQEKKRARRRPLTCYELSEMTLALRPVFERNAPPAGGSWGGIALLQTTSGGYCLAMPYNASANSAGSIGLAGQPNPRPDIRPSPSSTRKGSLREGWLPSIERSNRGSLYSGEQPSYEVSLHRFVFTAWQCRTMPAPVRRDRWAWPNSKSKPEAMARSRVFGAGIAGERNRDYVYALAQTTR